MDSGPSLAPFPNGNPPDLMKNSRKRRKRALHDEDSVPDAKRHCQRRRALPTPSPTASPKLKARCKPASRSSTQSQAKSSKPSCSIYQQDDEVSRRDLAPTNTRAPRSSEPAQPAPNPPTSWSSVDKWIEETPGAELVQQKVESGEIFPTLDDPFPEIPGADFQEASNVDHMSQRDGETLGAGSTSGVSSERLNTSSPLYRGTLNMNNVIIDDFGDMMPPDVRQLVNMHTRKARKSPKLEDEDRAAVKHTIREVWDSSEPIVSDIITPPLFPVKHPDIAEGRDTIWSALPLPRNPDYAYALLTPKTDRHFGFPPTRKSNWTAKELSAADHPKVRPYSQPTQANMFPFFLIEVKSETTGGTLYGAEGQLATSGVHRVNSLIWMLDQVDASRRRLSTDAIVFSAAVSQRQAVAHVHYFNPADNKFYMSWLDTFTYAKDGIQECHDFVKNVIEWMVDIQQPMIKDALAKLHPMTKLWR